MSLGVSAHITLGIPNLAATLPFYLSLGFKKVDESNEPHPWCHLSDGQIYLSLQQDGMTYRGLTYFAPDMEARIAELEERGIEFELKQTIEGHVFQAIFIGADSLPIGLVQYADATTPPPLTLNPKLGKFGELSLGVDNLSTSIAYWEPLGFDILHHSDVEGHQYAILTDGLILLGLHQTKQFRGPNFTYFSGDMANNIRNLRADGVPIANPMADQNGQVINAGLQAPDGQIFYLFTGEI